MQRHGLMSSNDEGELGALEQPAPLFDSRARAVAQDRDSPSGTLERPRVYGGVGLGGSDRYHRFANSPSFCELCLQRRSPKVAPLLFTLLTGLALIAPVVLTGHQIAQGSNAFVRALDRLRKSGAPVPAWLRSCRLPARSSISGGGLTSAILTACSEIPVRGC
jgi:hypothetical protein